MKNVLHVYLFALIFILSVSPAYSQSDPVVIDEIVYVIDGNTQTKALAALSYLEAGMEFSSMDTLIIALEREKQDLINKRVFEYVEYGFSEAGENRYSITLKVADAWTIIPIPYPDYDSNTGLRLGMKTYWNNFLGTMTDAYLGMSMDMKITDGKIDIGEWNINPKISGIRIGNHRYLSFSMTQAYVEEQFFDSIEPANDYDYSYLKTSFEAGTLFDFENNWAYGVKAGVDGRYNYSGSLGTGDQKEQPFAITLSHYGRNGQVDWLENRRKGYSTTLSNSYRIGTGKDNFFISDVKLSGSVYLPFWKRFYYYPKISGFYQWGQSRSNLGASLRGVQDNLLSGVTGVVFNNTLAFQFWRFEGVWDAQIHPFLDIGIVYNGESFHSDRDFNIGAGSDLVLYIDKLPSLVARATIGLDLRRFEMDNVMDYVEIIISSSLFY